MEKRSGERNVDIRFQVQLEEDGGGSTGQSWMETSSLWTMIHREQQGSSHICTIKPLSDWHVSGASFLSQKTCLYELTHVFLVQKNWHQKLAVAGIEHVLFSGKFLS